MSVAGLLGVEDAYTVDFPPDEEFHIVYGPNGVGKTKYLEAVDALCKLNLARLTAMPLDSARIWYDDDSQISFENVRAEGSVTLSWRRPDADDVTVHVPATDVGRTQTVRIGGTEWISIEPGIWQDPDDGEIASDDELRLRYGAVPPPQSKVVDGFEDFAASQKTLFIKTGRLLEYADPPRGRRLFQGRVGPLSRTTAARYAADIRMHLREALTDNSRKSAALDRTFPSRLLGGTTLPQLSEQDIRSRYQTQGDKRERLARLSLIGTESDLALPDRTLAEWEMRVLQMYLDDTQDKLETFDSVLERVELLEDILNRRFLGKQVSITAEDGIVVETERGHRIEPVDLSSGEQHELIMFYDMLFNVAAGSLVLIDEPEISLHVSWQREFLDDMRRACQLSSARVLLATHSPQIIGKWRSRTTPISPFRDWDEE